MAVGVADFTSQCHSWKRDIPQNDLVLLLSSIESSFICVSSCSVDRKNFNLCEWYIAKSVGIVRYFRHY